MPVNFLLLFIVPLSCTFEKICFLTCRCADLCILLCFVCYRVLCPPCGYICICGLLCFECYIYSMKVICKLVSVFVPVDGEKVRECVLIVLYALICMYYLYIYMQLDRK